MSMTNNNSNKKKEGIKKNTSALPHPDTQWRGKKEEAEWMVKRKH